MRHLFHLNRMLVGLGVALLIGGAGAGIYSLITKKNSSVKHSNAATEIIVPIASPAGQQWSLKFNDDFEGTAVDRTKWNIRENINYGYVHGEDQCYMQRNAIVANGSLQLKAKKETLATCIPSNPDRTDGTTFWTSAFVTTEGYRWGSPVYMPMTYEFEHGYIEASIKMPIGNPWWPAFWLVGSGTDGPKDITQSGEFDITEVTTIAPDVTVATLHFEGPSCSNLHCMTRYNNYNIVKDNSEKTPYSVANGTDESGLPFDKDGTGSNWLVRYVGATQSAYRRYGLYWDANGLTWYLDGYKIKSVTKDGLETTFRRDGTVRNTVQLPPGSPTIAETLNYHHAIHLNLAVGGGMPRNNGYTGTDAGSGSAYTDGNLWYDPNASAMLVDYVKVYQLEPANPSMADLNSDGKVDVYDLTTLLGKWNTTDTTADISKDGIVNVFDLSILLSKWTG